MLYGHIIIDNWGWLFVLGTIIDSVAIIIGGILGSLLKGGIPQKINDAVMKAIALSVILIGISGSLKSINILLIIISMVIGCVVGEVIDIDGALNKFGERVESKFKGNGGRISEAFITSTLLFCVGAMAVVGSLESGLTGNNKTLFVKSVLDGVSALVFASSMGIGVILSSVAVFLYQGILTLGAQCLKGILTVDVVNNMTSIGSLLIIALGLNMLKVDKIKVANLLPAVFVPIVYQLIICFLK